MRKKSIDAVIFDLGNVLIHVDPLPGIRSLSSQISGKSENEILHWFSESGPAEKYELGLLDDTAFYRESIHYFTGHFSFAQFSNAWNDIFSPNPPMIDLLSRLAGRIPLYLLSNTNQMHIDYLTRHYSFFNLFQKAYYSHEIHLRKPDEAIFSHVIQDLGLEARRSLFIDDKLENVRAAATCGFYAGHYAGGMTVQLSPEFNSETQLDKWFEKEGILS